ncbi:MAG: ATP-dependent Clp protease proteolytic subunit, partial [Anaerolineales bacterium]|nr:ATP-dependent Clp protease proteolytic subunit [Anaerolineales bacterium]
MKTIPRNQRLMASLLVCLIWCGAALNNAAARPVSQADQPRVLWLAADGPLTPAMVEYIQRGLDNAARQDAEAVVLQLNTPGGGVTLMNQIVTSLRASETPVVVYVAPRGAMAGSAGAVITLAGHAAAMAPETTIGAASPVGMQGEDLDQTSLAKETNILKATMRSLAERRGPQAVELAEAMIETAQAVSSQEALQAGLIDFIASSQSQLLEQLDGFQVETISGMRRLETSSAVVETQSASLIEELLSVLTDPNIVFLLITIGVQAILIEISSPGGWVAGTIGVVCLALAFYGVGVLDVNWFGAVFLILAFA